MLVPPPRSRSLSFALDRLQWSTQIQKHTLILSFCCVNKKWRTGNHLDELLLLSLWYWIMFFKWEGHALAHFSVFVAAAASATATTLTSRKKNNFKLKSKSWLLTQKENQHNRSHDSEKLKQKNRRKLFKTVEFRIFKLYILYISFAYCIGLKTRDLRPLY